MQPPRAGLGLWIGALGYLLVQLVFAILGKAWRALGGSVVLYLLVLLLSCGALIVASYRPGLLKGTALEKILLATGLPLLVGAAAAAWLKPYVFIRVPEWLGGYSFVTALHPVLPSFLNLLLFLAALGHVAQLGPRWGRWLLLDIPMLATAALVLALHAYGYPEFQG